MGLFKLNIKKNKNLLNKYQITLLVKIGITVFPGSNCDRDVYSIFKTKLESDIRYIKDKDKIKKLLMQLLFLEVLLMVTDYEQGQ